MKKYSAKAIHSLLILSMVVTTFSFTPLASAQASGSSDEAPIVPGEFIVVYKEIATDKPTKKALSQSTLNAAAKVKVTRDAVEKKFKNKTKKKFSKALNGFSAKLTSADVRELKANPAVEYVVPNRVIKMSAADTSTQTVPTGIDRINANGIANKGTGINVAVIDTGIDSSHPDLAGQVVGGTNCIDPGSTSYQDDNQHGTHVAGTIAALDNNIGVVGVAPEAKLWSIKVLDKNGSGTWESVICGLDYVTANAPANGGPITVVNMSLSGYSTSTAMGCGVENADPLHAATCRTRDAGVTIVVAAGNNGYDVSKRVPAAYNDAVITVSALADYDGMQGSRLESRDDTFANWSNYNRGKIKIVDIAAPGVSINSTILGKKYGPLSGTSMAAPHVAGAAALYIAEHKGATWTEVREALVAAGEPAGPGTHKAYAMYDKDKKERLEPVLLVTPNPTLPDAPDGYLPIITRFVGPPLPIVPGYSANLSISVSNASTTTLEADGIAKIVTGSQVVSPLKTTTYKLIATNPFGSVTATTEVKVLPGEPREDMIIPTVRITSPAVNVKKVSAGSEINVAATASDNAGVAKVEFFVGSALICSDTEAPYGCPWTVPANASAGSKYTVSAGATDINGNTSGRMGRILTVKGVKPPPTPPGDITITEPTFSPLKIGRRGKVQIDSNLVFKTDLPNAAYAQYYVKDSQGNVLHTGKLDFISTSKKAKHNISIKPVLKPKTNGDSLVFVVEVRDKQDKVIFEKISTTKIEVVF